MVIQTMKYYFKYLLILVLLVGCGSSEDNKESEIKTSPDVKSESIVENNYSNAKKDKNESDIKVTFVELGSVNCIPCKMMQPIMKEIEKEYSNQVKVVFHDVWTEQDRPYAIQYGIRVIPTQIFLDKDGKEYFRHEGFFPKEELVKILKKQDVN